MDKAAREGLLNYKKIVDGLIEMEELWKTHQDFCTTRPNLEEFPRAAQRFMKYSYNRSKMVMGLPRMLENARVIGGLDSMRFEMPEEPKSTNSTKKGDK